MAQRDASETPVKQAFRASSWRPHLSGTLRGFFDLRLPSGLVIHDLTAHEMNGRRWVAMPGKPLLDSDGRHRTYDRGKKAYVATLEIPDRDRRDKFTEQALAALDKLLRQ